MARSRAPMIAQPMTEFARPRAHEAAAARIFRRLQDPGRAPGGTAPDAHDRHDAARPDGGDLSRDAARAAELGLGALSERLRRSRHGGRVRRLVRRRRAFSPSRLGCRSPIPPSCRKTSGASARRWGASSPTIFSPPASPSRDCRRSTLLVSPRDGSRTSATRGRSRPPRGAPFPTRSTSCRGRRSTNGSPWPRGAGSRRFRRRRSPRAALSILWAQGAGQTLLDQGLDFVEATLERYKATIVKHVAQKSSRWIPKWVDDMIAAKVINGLTETLKEMRDPDHPWREQANELIEKLIDDLAHDPDDARARRGVEAGNSGQSGVRRAGAGAAGGTGDGAEGRSASPRRGDRRLACGLGRRARAGGSKRTARVGRESIGGSDCWRCARCCRAGPKSAPISPRWSTIGTPRRSSTASNCKSARTCNISASTGRWSAAWSGF